MFRKPPEWFAWLTIATLLSASLLGAPAMLGYAIAASGGYLAHGIVRDGSARSFPVQVRGAYLALMVVGVWPELAFLHWIQCVGVWTMLATDYCFLARCLSVAPWNRREPLSWSLLSRTFFSRPRPGIFAEAPALKAPVASLPQRPA